MISATVALAMQSMPLPPPAPRYVSRAPADYELVCVLAGRDGRLDRFGLVAAGSGADRLFALRPEGSALVGPVTAGSAREGNGFHFVSNGIPYRLVLDFDRSSGPLTANAKLDEDRGLPALNLRRGQGSCRGSARTDAAALPAMPAAPEVRPAAYRMQPTGLREGRVPSDCLVILRNLGELRFGLEATFDDQGIRLAVSPTAGQTWPARDFALRGAALATQIVPAGEPGFMTVLASAGATPGSDVPAQLGYVLHAQQALIEGWIEIRVHGDPELVGAGYCGTRGVTDEERARRP